MATYLVSVLVDDVLLKLSPPYIKELEKNLSAKAELQRLKDTLSTIKAPLVDMEKTQLTDDSVRNWLMDLEDVVCNIDEVFNGHLEKDRGAKRRNLALKSMTQLLSPFDLVKWLKDTCRRLGEIADRQKVYGLEEQGSRVNETVEKRETYPVVQESFIIGRVHDREEIVSRLLSSSYFGPVIPIVGMGGIGKTTLAKSVFDDHRIAENFELRLWVYVSHKFVWAAVVEDIIKSATGRVFRYWNINVLKMELHRILADSSCLIVLDHVWIVDPKQLAQLVELLGIGHSKSRIIVTTRSSDVAPVTLTTSSHLLKGLTSDVGPVTLTTSSHLLKGLTSDDSWYLFAKCAFGEGEEEAYPLLVQIGKSIVSKCQGVPLAVKLLGSALRCKRDDDTWKRVAESELLEIDQQSGILPALKISFDLLPFRLKQCLALCAIFEEGCLLRRFELISLWMAHGLLQPPEGTDDIEDTGHLYFDELLSRSFFQVSNQPLYLGGYRRELNPNDLFPDYDEKVNMVVMHDLIHELAKSVAREEIATVNRNLNEVSARVRHVVWDREDLFVEEFPKGLVKAGRAITFVFLHPMSSISISFLQKLLPQSFLENLLSNFKFLIVLMLRGSEFEELPDLVGELNHLRLLDVSGNPKLRVLPDSISNLANLQTLDVSSCSQLEKLPNDVSELVNLRNLNLTFWLKCLPEIGLHGLISLRHLQIQDCCNLESLADCIGSLENVRHLVIANCARLVSLPDSIRGLTKLEELKICGCLKLDLTSWQGLKGLNSLRCLSFSRLDNLLDFPDGISSAASSLQYFMIDACPQLKRLPEDLVQCTSLLKLKLYSCRRLIDLPCGIKDLKNLRELDINKCPTLSERCEMERRYDRHLISHLLKIVLDGEVIQTGVPNQISPPLDLQSTSMADTHEEEITHLDVLPSPRERHLSAVDEIFVDIKEELAVAVNQIMFMYGVLERVRNRLTTHPEILRFSTSTVENLLENIQKSLSCIAATCHLDHNCRVLVLDILKEIAYDVEDVLDVAINGHWFLSEAFPKYLLHRLEEVEHNISNFKQKDDGPPPFIARITSRARDTYSCYHPLSALEDIIAGKQKDKDQRIDFMLSQSEDECWSLFKRCAAFDEDAEQAFPLLKQIGRSIVENCRGSALAVKTLGSALHTNKDEHTWKEFSDIILKADNKVEAALQLSLTQVPYDVMQCFAASAIFLKDKSMSVDQLVRIWMALGLLQQSEGNEDLKDIGYRYFDELLLRGFLQLQHQSDCPSHVIAQMHNEVHSLALSLTGEEVAFVHGNKVSASSRHLVLTADSSLSFHPDEEFLAPKRARTFLFKTHMGANMYSYLEVHLSKLMFVRVLLLEDSEFENLPEKVCNLKLLRYLSLAGNKKLRVLPGSLCQLVNLQTLDLSGCTQLEELPKGMHKLSCLRHFLQSLKKTDLPENFFDGLTSLNQLKICNCESLTWLPEEISKLNALQILQIHDCPSIASLPNSINCLSRLKELSILDCRNMNLTVWEGLKGLTSLQFLHFGRLWRLREWPPCLMNCSSLLQLNIDTCPNLVAMPKEIQAVKTLQILKINGCPELLRRLQLEKANDWALISHIPKIYLDKILCLKRQISASKSAKDVSQLPVSFTPPKYGADDTHLNCVRDKEYIEEKLEKQEPDIEDDEKGKRVPKDDIRCADKFHHLTSSSGKTENLPKEMDEAAVRTDIETESSPEIHMEIVKRCCFIFFLLSEDYEFEKDTLIQLWMAGETIKNESDGELYFHRLLKEGYMLYSGTNFVTRIDRYRLNIKKLNEELSGNRDNDHLYLKWENGKQNKSSEIEHVSLLCNDTDFEQNFQRLQSFQELRTLLFLRNYGHRVKEVPYHLFLSLEKLQVLDLSRTAIQNLPSSFICMVHLRYLDLSWTPIEQLPEIICILSELQTLKLKGCTNLRQLPEQIKMLKRLRHLEVNVLGQLSNMPTGIGSLKNLRTLSAFLVGPEDGCKIQELKNLNNLTGSFCIAMLEHVESANEAGEAALLAKNHLKKLELRWTTCEVLDNGAGILDCLQPCSSLEELNIFCYGGLTFPSWIGDLNQLVSITFFKCEHVLELPPLEQLPSLRYLSLEMMDSVERIYRRVSKNQVAFPKLEKLDIAEMNNLETWSWTKENIGDFECLAEITIKSCPKLQKIQIPRYLSTITYLEAKECLELRSLSDDKLPDSLKDLIVEDCPEVIKRCSEQGGEDWWKIEHVQNKRICQTDAGDDDEDDDADEDEDEDHEDAKEGEGP